jgi:hypothetical protein
LDAMLAALFMIMSIAQNIVLVPNLLHLQWGMVGKEGGDKILFPSEIAFQFSSHL